jgi:hypothetical protein
MYRITITHVRQSVETSFFWETDQADHNTAESIVATEYEHRIVIGNRTYSEDRLTTKQIFLAESVDIYYDCKKILDGVPELIHYWLNRDNYNFDNDIFRHVNEEDV